MKEESNHWPGVKWLHWWNYTSYWELRLLKMHFWAASV